VQDIGIVELDEMSEGQDIQDYLTEKTGQRTVPQIFISGRHIGGNSDLQQLQSSGELQKLISA
jgi:glutaredoxin 3